MSIDEFRRVTTNRVHRIKDYNFLTEDVVITDPRKVKKNSSPMNNAVKHVFYFSSTLCCLLHLIITTLR